jgi:hypothetical protein
MDTPSNFFALWNSLEEFDPTHDQPDVPTCLFAQEFSKWATELYTKATSNPSIVAINQAKVLLTDKFFEFRGLVPKAHRRRIGKAGHECIFQVFEKTYLALRWTEIQLTPPKFSEERPSPPPLPPPPPPPQIAGIFLGELLDER